uniref:Uncharacterized protein n=1 Tax=Oryza brachyantha TaxID=4533 RepID=J3MH75_ORYBR
MLLRLITRSLNTTPEECMVDAMISIDPLDWKLQVIDRLRVDQSTRCVPNNLI